MGKIGKQNSMTGSGGKKWLLLFYTVPSKPVNARMKIWRKLAKAGAVQFKSAVYILPGNEENHELCQWLVSEITSMKGEGAFVSVDRIETMSDREIIDLFNSQREKDYLAIEKELVKIERTISSAIKGTRLQHDQKVADQLNKRLKEFDEVRKIDFFTSKAGTALKKKLDSMRTEMKRLSGTVFRSPSAITVRNPDDYRGRTWATRRNPFIDRMASAWLIRKFIDSKAVFTFIDETEVEHLRKDQIAYDIRGGEFTHVGDKCTFEVLVSSFSLKDKRLRRIAEIVHELDLKDEKYSPPEANGVENILKGIRTTAEDDADILEKGIVVFEMLYVSKT